MKLRLFAQKPPHGRCLMLAQKISQVTVLSPNECVALAERIFAFAHKRENPAVIEVSEPSLAHDLTTLCTEFGISVETTASVDSTARGQASRNRQGGTP
jgi:hypothetical protein